MLQKLTRQTWKKYVDYAYELALCPARTSYPVYYDGIKTKEDFISRTEKAFDLEEGEPCGWIHYYGLTEAMLNACKTQGVRNLIFFNDQESQSDALALGFTCVGKYVLMVKKEGAGQ